MTTAEEAVRQLRAPRPAVTLRATPLPKPSSDSLLLGRDGLMLHMAPFLLILAGSLGFVYTLFATGEGLQSRPWMWLLLVSAGIGAAARRASARAQDVALGQQQLVRRDRPATPVSEDLALGRLDRLDGLGRGAHTS